MPALPLVITTLPTAEDVEPNPNVHVHTHQFQSHRGSIPEGDRKHVMPRESFSYLFLAALRFALGLPAVTAGG